MLEKNMPTELEAIDAFNNKKFKQALELAKQALQEGQYTDLVLKMVSALEMKIGDPQSGFNLFVKHARETRTAYWTFGLTYWLGSLFFGYSQRNGKFTRFEFTEESLTDLLETIAVNLETGFGENDKRITANFLIDFGRIGYLVDETPFQSYPQLCKRILPFIPISRKLIPESIIQNTDAKSPAYWRFGAYFLSSCGQFDIAEKLIEKISTPYKSKTHSRDSSLQKLNYDDTSAETYEIPQIERTSRRLIALTKNRFKLGRVLDIGCGTGMTSALIKKKASIIHGIDINCVYLAVAEKKGIYKQLNDANILEWQDFSTKYDTILSCMLTYVISDLNKFLSIVRCLLEDQGRAYIDFLTVSGSADQREIGDYILRTNNYIKKSIKGNGLRILRETIGPNQFSVGTYLEIVKAEK